MICINDPRGRIVYSTGWMRSVPQDSSWFLAVGFGFSEISGEGMGGWLPVLGAKPMAEDARRSNGEEY